MIQITAYVSIRQKVMDFGQKSSRSFVENGHRVSFMFGSPDQCQYTLARQMMPLAEFCPAGFCEGPMTRLDKMMLTQPDRYQAIDPNTGLPMFFEPYVPKHHLMQRLACGDLRETPDGLFYRSEEGGLVYVPRDIPPLRPSDDRRSAVPKCNSSQAYQGF